ncbi:alpha-mannosyltransferase, partial [Cladochytrium replicatum]
MLPIEVWQFAGELNSTHIHAIESLGDNIRVRSADDFKNNVFPVEKGTEKGAGKASSGQAARNFHIKVAAIINSAFEEVLSLDADVMPIRNPDYLFQYPDFKEDGAIFWPDYWKTAMWNPVWAWTGIPCLDEWEQESGILVISKPKSWKALHLSMFMNHDDDTRFWRRFIHGDKDTFRFAWHATRTPFTYVQHWLVPGGFLHQPKKPKSPVEFCGNTMIQHDPDGRLLFLHTNLFKELEWELYNKSSPMLTHFKRYKRN